jgi:hypothetical protein
MVGAACAIMLAPTDEVPVNATISTAACVVSNWAPATPGSSTIFSAPSGKPASLAASANSIAESGVSGLGRNTTVLPAISAGMTFHIAV